jgi:septation ring formation regulator EzrA
MDIKELEQKYSDLEGRLSKVEDCLREVSRRHQGFRQAIVRFRKETLSQTGVQEGLGDSHCSR